jgi:asparagine synthase (glutamine-hydrolysing)
LKESSRGLDMCGIAGVFSQEKKPVDESIISAMCSAMVHRGPDDKGSYIDSNVGMGMTRLSIIDIENGNQPVSNKDQTFWVVSNGEIYNFQEIRKWLIQIGYEFRSRSDTEVIAHLYEEFGVDCVKYLRGMFAFAIWDSRRKQLMIARDRIGIKPLYYFYNGRELVFASELKSLLQYPAIDRKIDIESLQYLFAFMTTPPDASIIAGVKKLEPGHFLLVGETGGLRLARYWDVEFAPDRSRSEDSFSEEIQERLLDSVKSHLVSDVPVGVFLSGGVDSSAVAATMASISDRPINTFSIGYKNKRFDESSEAKRFADQIGARHKELILESDALSSLDEIAWYLDEPFGDASAIPTYMVSRLAAKEVKVVLSGDGGDELFAGYDKYRVEQRQRMYDRIPSPLRSVFAPIALMLKEGAPGRRFLYQLSMSGSYRYLNSLSAFRYESKGSVFSPEIREEMAWSGSWKTMAACLEGGPDHWLSRLQYMDIHRYLPLDILTKVDRMSMANSLEVRVPLLDHKFVEFAATIPPEMLLDGSESKAIFKKALHGLVPEYVSKRPKRGFAVPLGDWFRNDLSGLVRELLLSDRARARGIFNLGYVEQIIRLHEGGRHQDDRLWLFISFELWCRNFLDSDHSISTASKTLIDGSSRSVAVS